MKIAIPSEGKNLESDVNKTFGRTDYFLIVDSKTFDFEHVENKAANSQGGAGIIAAQTVCDYGADILITFQCGKNAAEVLEKGSVKIYKAVSGSVKDVIEKFNNDNLEKLDNIHPGYHNRGN
jgi:predicted Fe-Mo cluster-binding NifX family protein